MPINVRFRGPMLFVTDNPADHELEDVVDRVIIPDASEPDVHADGSAAKPHTAALLLIEPGRPKVYMPLRRSAITISAEGELEAPTVDDKYLSVPPIHEMTNPPGTREAPVQRKSVPSESSTTITFRGGFMSGELLTESGIELPRHKDRPLHRPLCSMPVWCSRAAKGKIEIKNEAGDRETIEVNGMSEVYIYNWDTAFPAKGELTAPLEVLHSPFQDDDFKWIYNLLVPPQDSWKQWLDGELFLPAPRSRNFLHAIVKAPSANPAAPLAPEMVLPAGGPSIGTCDGARWRGRSQ